MKHQTFTRLLSLLLTFALLLGCCPFAFAAEADAPSEPEIIADQTEAPTESEAPGGVDLNPSETTSETEETEATEATEITEATEATEATEVTEAEELLGAAEAEPAELPYGLKGLPEGYALSQEQLDIKQDMIDHDVCATTEGLMPGKDYVENELVVLADTQEEAELYAAAFNAELAEYSFGVATLRLTGEVTVPQAVAASADMSLPLPAVSPNHIIRLNPVEVDSADYQKAASVPTMQDWDSWDISDPFLRNPAQRDDYGTVDKWDNSNGDASGFQYAHDAVDSYAAWGVTTGSNDLKVAVLDTGVYRSHPDLKEKVSSFTVNSAYGDSDSNGHGTHVAGIIAATMNNNKGGAGIAPNVKILNIKVLGPDGGTSDDINRGINKAVSEGASVINMSLGGYFYNPSEAAAVKSAVDAGICVVAAMGNDGSNTMCYPAGYPGVIAVGAADRSGNRAFFSNWGAWLDVSAPGYSILSTCKNGGYQFMSGTSQATPVVSGVVALYKSIHPDAKPAEIEARLKKTATKAGSNLGAGIVNAAKMLSDQPALPDFSIADGNYENYYEDTAEYRGKPVPCDSYLEFYCNQYSNPFIVYTLDGTTPAVMNGEVVKGTVYTEGTRIALSAYAGSSVTVKAIQINGLGMASKVLSKKVTVQKTSTVLGVTVNGPSKVIAGKSVQLTAEVLPVDKADQGVTWSIIDKSDNMATAKIDAKGKLTVPKLSAGEGTVTVQAASKTDPEKKGTLEIKVVLATPVTKITLDKTKLTLLAGCDQKLNAAVTGPESAELSWTSSNRKVATVDKDGVVKALSAGKATITCAALDGSGKSAKCTVTVTQPVTGIDITGQTSIAPGASATYKAAILPSKAGNKAVEWRLAEGAPSGITVSAKGAVKVEALVTVGTSFTLLAAAKDGSGIVGQKQITVASKCTTLTVNANESSIGRAPGVTKNKSDVITAIGLFNVDLPNTEGSENCIDLSADTGSAAPTILWTSSNPAVVSVAQSENGVSIRAEKAGSAKITAAAQDGSGKKATVTVNVTVPASSIAIQGPTERMIWPEPYLACGKSAANKAVFADTYGKPSNQKVTWSYTARIAGGSDVTAYVASQKWISVKNGKLSVSPKMSSYVVNTVGKELLVTVTATATDGTGVSGSITYSVVKPATKMTMITRGGTVSSGKKYTAYFSCDQWFPYNNPKNCDFIATSSNPEVASAEITGFTEDYYKGMPVYGVRFATGHKAGTAKITIKTVDGSNKSCSITVKVK